MKYWFLLGVGVSVAILIVAIGVGAVAKTVKEVDREYRMDEYDSEP